METIRANARTFGHDDQKFLTTELNMYHTPVRLQLQLHRYFFCPFLPWKTSPEVTSGQVDQKLEPLVPRTKSEKRKFFVDFL